jgi:hypothetical protein
MKISIYNLFKLFSVFSLIITGSAFGQEKDTTTINIKRVSVDTSSANMNMDAVYNRLFLTAGKTPIALGGYLEANSIYSSTDGVSRKVYLFRCLD